MVWDRVRDTLRSGGHPSWCDETDCYYYDSGWCNDCEACAICGDSLGYHGRNKHKGHLFRAESHGGRTWVPTCSNCNQSRKEKGFVTWLRWLYENNRRLYEQIVDYQGSRSWEDDWVRETVLEIDREIR